MALKVLLLRSRLDKAKKELETLREKDGDFQKREAEIEAAINEMDENTPDEDRNEVESQAENFHEEKEAHDGEKKRLEEEIDGLERDIKAEEEKQTEPEKKDKEEREEHKAMETRTKFFGMNIQERDAFFAREDVRGFLGEVRTCIKEKRALDNIGLAIPEVMLELLKARVEETSKLLRHVSVRPVAGKARQNVMGSVPEAIWTEMCARLNELNLGFNDVEVDGYKVGGFFTVCNAILEDNDVNLAAEIINAIGKAIGKAIDKAILYGTGSKMPLGVVTRLAQKAKPSDYSSTAREWANLSVSNVITGTGAAGVELFKEIVSNTGVIDNDYSEREIVWLMNKKTHTKLKVEAMGTNMNAAIVSGMDNTMPVAGGVVEELSFIPDDDVIFGYFDMYLLAERAGTTLGQSEHVRFIDDQTVFKGTARYDGTPVIAEAFGVMNIGKVAPQTSVTFPGDTANDATLKSLELEGAALTPVFSAATHSYTATSTAASVTVGAVPTQKDAKAAVKKGDKEAANGKVSLETGKNVITVEVTNGTGKQVYTVTVTKS